MDRSATYIVLALFAFNVGAAAQPEAPYGLAQISSGDKVTLYWFYPAINESTIASFDDEPVSYYFYSGSDVGARVATAFELPPETKAIAAVDIFLWPSDPLPNYPGGVTTPFDLSIYENLPADTNVVAVWQRRTTNSHPGLKRWLNIPVRESIDSDSAYVEFRWLPGTPTAPLPGVVYCDRFVNSYEGTRQGESVIWRQIYDSAILIRLQTVRFDIGTTVEDLEAMPDSFCVYVLDSPEGSDEQTTVFTVCDSLHLTMERNEVEGKFVTVVACDSGLVSAKSEMLKVDVSTNVEWEQEEIVPATLLQNYPNPFNLETTICAELADDVAIYDLLGRIVRNLSSTGGGKGGAYYFRWDGTNDSGESMPSGVYFYRQIGQAGVRKLILLK